MKALRQLVTVATDKDRLVLLYIYSPLQRLAKLYYWFHAYMQLRSFFSTTQHEFAQHAADTTQPTALE